MGVGSAMVSFFVGLLVLLLLIAALPASAADQVVYTTDPLNNCAGANVGQGGTASAAAADAVAKFTNTGNAYGCPYGLSVQSVAEGVYDSATQRYLGGAIIARYTGETFSISVIGTCSGGCAGPSSSSPSDPTSGIALDGSRVGFWVVAVGTVLAWGLGFIGGRMR